ncbi:alpha/beta fold hydrolase [Rhodococcus sp. WS4]|nr:alpha/beta fold hydrolase [Rhodococcus sp. WS4]
MTATSPPTVYLLHGYLDDGYIWGPVQALLGKAGVDSHAPTYPWQSGSTLQEFAAEVVREIDEEQSKSVLLVGHSMGAPVAELVASALGSGRVAGLILVTPLPLGGLTLPDEVAGPLRECGESGDIQRALRTQLSLSMPPDVLNVLVDRGSKIPVHRVEAVFDAWTAGDPQAANRPAPAVPTCVVTTDDVFVDDRVLALVRDRHGTAQYAKLPGVGHWPHAEDPTTVAGLILDFMGTTLDGHEGSSTITSSWTSAFEARSKDAFATEFTEDVRLEAAALLRPVHGREQVAAVMQAASSMYEHLEFTAKSDSGALRFLTWVARTHSGLDLSGVTVLEHDESGKISSAAIHHRPLGNLLKFSSELGEKLEGRVGRDHFWDGEATT